MQFSEHWLRSFVDPPLTTDELAHLLTMGGLEVEDIHAVAPAFTGIVVGLVREVAKHPNADRLTVCTVDTGTDRDLQIVCGAPNVRSGIKVPCALVGARLPPPQAGGEAFEIKLAQMRGVESQGMLCSARELKLSDDHSGLLILDESAPVGDPVREVLDLDDHLLTLKLTPNKADCLSVFGVAREVAALSGAPLFAPAISAAPVAIDDRLPVKILAPDLCGRFSGRIIRGVDPRAATPEWMKQRLIRSGQRSISALVDISNYVMLELGRPSHVFDLKKIHGGLEVRWGRAGESLKLLNGSTVEVDPQVGVIADEDAVESLAGIMGGDATAVSLDTTDIYLEAAFWWPEAIQGRARRYNFSTDAAHRFERGVDPSTTVDHLERISQLILEICGGKAGPIDDQIVNLPPQNAVRMRVSRATKVMGIAVSALEIAQIFRRLNFSFVEEPDAFVVTAPSYRFDIAIEEDLIEEVARCHGFERIPAHLPVARQVMLPNEEGRRSLHTLRDLLAAADYQEVMNFSFVEPAWEEDLAGNTNPIRLVNPIAAPLSVMRSTLMGGLIANLRYNLNRKAARVRIFEVSKVSLRDSHTQDGPLSVAGIDQPTLVAGLAYGPSLEEQWGAPSRPVDFFDVKSDLEMLFAPGRARFAQGTHPALHPGRSARLERDGELVGWLGELHPRWLQKYELPHAPILFELRAICLQRTPLPQITEIPKFPAVSRDIAFFFRSDVQAQDVQDAIEKVRAENRAAGLIRDVTIFDEYRGKGLKDNEKSLAFRLRLQDTHQTLSDEIVEEAMAAVTSALRDKFGALPRT
ncbi:MAG: phenylalanine--tRNA ligase subunit beta [Burkholderiaceae bacterium]|jgi:phenylalanyl-tRNA synthetase beta chain